MRIVLGLVTALVLAAGCQKDASPEAPAPTAPATPTAAALPAATAPMAAMGEHASCGGSCGGMCGNQACGGSCGGGAEVATPVTPADAQWTALRVAGMHCGGCVKRVKNALASVDGVLGVEVDLGKAEVRVATAKGRDARAIASAPITALGYQVLAN